ncbi:disintegrin and metalloproteinase domain-containing protein 10-like isoform X3 [Lingula anatina]|uniref:ADAM10 endopeptidase n=1 Tax=Lingula anatina TaxID=7574 RepID=A0A1S3K0T7_LINAN|nr:disintegrin and metalloproteinase domain-containing protein 10-like isoform X3 [Lingula anatina]|eukprot:XP_013415901.1 disintegrin and metalloproteinase domain-containing protein 10-like isoform X3 [Lingula anatina]
MEMKCRRIAWVTVVICLQLRYGSGTKNKLNDYISHYEELNYDANDLHNLHLRAKRSLSDQSLNLRFKAHSRNFNLELQKDSKIFSKNADIEYGDGSTKPLDTSFLYRGQLRGEPGSSVYGSVLGGVFTGTIESPETGRWHIEHANKYFSKEVTEKKKFHSIIYHEDHMDMDPYRHIRSAAGTAQCGSSNSDIADWMSRVQNSAVDVKKRSYRTATREDHQREHNIYSEALNREKREEENRQKRATVPVTTPQNNTCSLLLQSDPALWDHMIQMHNDEMRTEEAIIAMFHTHVTAIKDIYQKTIFETYDGSKKLTGYSFRVQRVRVFKRSDCSQANVKDFCIAHIDVSNFLNLNSKMDHDKYCLAYMFTYRDFTGGTLGLAWVGSSGRASGGICERWKEYSEQDSSGSKVTKVYKSLNTGIVTFINYGQTVPSRVSSLTLAHEIGHNFGSPHDQGSECTPYTSMGDRNGNYIMFASATSGDKSNNKLFSPCSKDNITLVLDALNRGTKANCLIGNEAAFCGNNIVEEGEECDCGFANSNGECTDKCCNPAVESGSSSNACKRKPGKVCSPSQGPCCDADTCDYVPESRNLVCRAAADCNEQQICKGTNYTCPDSRLKADFSSCKNNTKVCKQGECTGSICERIESNNVRWEECFIKADLADKEVDKTSLCYVSCREGNATKCWSSLNQKDSGFPDTFKDMLQNVTNGAAIKAPPGAPCNNFAGYCDVFYKCRGVDADGPLARLKNLLFNEQTLNSIKDWIITYWWAVVLMIIGLIIFMALFIKLCAVHTPSSNPNKKPARKVSETMNTLRHPRQSIRQYREGHRHPQEPPPPYPGPSQGAPPHGRGKRSGGKGGRKEQVEMKGRRV